MADLCIIPARAVADPALTPHDIRVLCAIGRHTDGEGKGAWASARRMAAEAAIDRKTFFVSARRLLQLGYIERASRQGRTSVYRIVLQGRELRSTRTVGRYGSEKSARPDPSGGTTPDPSHGPPPVPSATGHKRPQLKTPVNEADGADGVWGTPPLAAELIPPNNSRLHRVSAAEAQRILADLKGAA